MANNVSGAFKSGHNKGYKEAKSYQSKSELAKWIDAAGDVFFGSSKPRRSGDYKAGTRAGWKNAYGKR